MSFYFFLHASLLLLFAVSYWLVLLFLLRLLLCIVIVVWLQFYSYSIFIAIVYQQLFRMGSSPLKHKTCSVLFLLFSLTQPCTYSFCTTTAHTHIFMTASHAWEHSSNSIISLLLYVHYKCLPFCALFGRRKQHSQFKKWCSFCCSGFVRSIYVSAVSLGRLLYLV